MKKIIMILLTAACLICTGVTDIYAGEREDNSPAAERSSRKEETVKAGVTGIMDIRPEAAPAEESQEETAESARTEDGGLKADLGEESNTKEYEHNQQDREETATPQEGTDISIREGSELEPEEAEALGLKEDAVFFTADAAKSGRSGEQVTLTIGKTVRYGAYTTNYFYINGQLAWIPGKVPRTEAIMRRRY